VTITWTDYIRYRAELRGFDLQKMEEILRYSAERYFDASTRRHVVAGKHDERLVIIVYDRGQGEIIPVTIHSTTRQQINYRLKAGRFVHEENHDDLFQG
jgi:hypothetical protein